MKHTEGKTSNNLYTVRDTGTPLTKVFLVFLHQCGAQSGTFSQQPSADLETQDDGSGFPVKSHTWSVSSE